MTRRNLPSRSGITLTEILISIMIMGVGLVSLATLFPLGLVRLREAQRYTRSAFLFESAVDDAQARALLNKNTFLGSWYSFNGTGYDPFSYDPPGGMPAVIAAGAALPPAGGAGYDPNTNPVRTGPGLPIAYDPLWWAVVHQYTAITTNGLPLINPQTTDFAARFGYGIPWVRPDPSDNGPASAYGLQRITNFLPFGAALNWPFVYPAVAGGQPDRVGEIFASQDDPVMQSESDNQPLGTFSADPNYPPPPVMNVKINQTGLGSPLVPDLSTNAPMNDWSYSWMFVGNQYDVSDLTTFNGSIVIFHNRALGVETVNTTFGGPQTLPMGERVVEAIYGLGGRKQIVLRWPTTDPEPDVRVGSWICDVTYERFSAVQAARNLGLKDAQRNYWYQVTKRSPVNQSPGCQGDPNNVLFNQMTVTVSSQLQAITPNIAGTFDPLHVNVALICPSVVNVFATPIYMR
jgi:type II secretory pathway pseudopilin PulG